MMRVVIAGGGNMGTFVADQLRQAGHDVVIVEEDPDRVAHATMNDEPPGVAWLAADACEVSELVRADPATADVVCAVTGDDEDNLVISLLAKQEFGVPRVVARVNNPANAWLFDETWGVDVAVSTSHLVAALVEQTVSVGSLVRLLGMGGGRASLVEVTLAADSPATDRSVADIDLPAQSSIVAVLRSDDVVVPSGDTVLLAGDQLLLVVTRDCHDEALHLLVAEPGTTG